MDFISKKDVLSLLDLMAEPCVSIYMPSHVGGIEMRQDVLRLKNLLRQAGGKLERTKYRKVRVNKLLKPVAALLEDQSYWSACSDGLAILISPDVFFAYRLPLEFRESVEVGDRFRIRPLLPAIDSDTRGYVLALSQDQAKLYRVSPHACEAVHVPAMPTNMREALDYTSVDRGAQLHTLGKGPRKKQAAVFHGQAVGQDSVKQDLQSYFRIVDRVICDYLHTSKAPLLLACVGYLAPIYQGINRYPGLLGDFLEGNPDHLSIDQISESAQPHLAAHFSRPLLEQLARWKELTSDHRTTNDPYQIIPAAVEGRVEVLFFDKERDLWGRYDRVERAIDVHDVRADDDSELIELAARETLLHRGTVFPLAAEQLPSPTALAAILRYVPA